VVAVRPTDRGVQVSASFSSALSQGSSLFYASYKRPDSGTMAREDSSPHEVRFTAFESPRSSNPAEREPGFGSKPTTRFGPTTPKRPPGLLLVLCRLNRLSCRRTLFAAERLSPSARERVRRLPFHR
jgi:hypothetical protein